MPATYKAIATVTVGSGNAASIEFASIPGTYTDLILKVSARTDRNNAAVDNIRVGINGESKLTSIDAARNLYGDGSAAASGSYIQFTGGIVPTSTATTSTFGNGELYFTNYAGSNNKSISTESVGEQNGTTAYALINAAAWNDTAAITTITLYPDVGNNFLQYSTATLYGIKNS